MPINFDQTRWEKIRSTHRQWWDGQLERPLIPLTLGGGDPGRPEPETPLLSQSTCHDLGIPAERLIDRIDYELSRQTWLGDAFPYFNMHCFGPGVLAAILGATLDNSTGRVWFHPPAPETPIQEIHFRFDPDNIWFRRLCEIYGAGMQRWQGQVLMGMTDLGGGLDVLSTFRPGEALLLDLYDHPDEVKRLVGEEHEAWHQCYNALNSVLRSANPGYSDWAGIFSDKPGYVLQSDFSYMTSHEMFEEFALPELAASCRRLERSMYHLDGVGQLQNLDSILTIPELGAVQWVPGDGKPDHRHWPQVHQKIAAAGKRFQLFGGPAAEGLDILDCVSRQIGTAKGIHLRCGLQFVSGDELKTLRERMSAYGVG
jgi:5-methyltetrahydrofolate--homocysteine methyltransferase